MLRKKSKESRGGGVQAKLTWVNHYNHSKHSFHSGVTLCNIVLHFYDKGKWGNLLLTKVVKYDIMNK
jgi:hypothetical protein